jgi:large subunit ribosomal protein L30
MPEKEKHPKKDVDALLTEVASAAGVPKKSTKTAPAAPAKAGAPATAPKTIRIRQVRSGICTPVDQKQALKGLGLRRIRQEVVRLDTPAIRGQILKVRHLVEVVGE